MSHETFNTIEVADYLHISAEDVSRLVRSNDIPYENFGGRTVFRKQDVDAWASQRILGLPRKELSNLHDTSTRKVDLFSDHTSIFQTLIKESFVEPTLESKTRAAVIRDMVAVADATKLVNYSDELLSSIREREDMCSTALAGGCALLHPRHHDLYMFEDSFVCFGRTINPVPFGAPDGNTTDLFFLICCENDRLHLHVLARLCMLFYRTSLEDQLRDASTAAEILQTLQQAEAEILKT